MFQLIDIFHNIYQAFDDNMFYFIVFCDVSKLLIASGTRVLCLSSDKMELEGNI